MNYKYISITLLIIATAFLINNCGKKGPGKAELQLASADVLSWVNNPESVNYILNSGTAGLKSDVEIEDTLNRKVMEIFAKNGIRTKITLDSLFTVLGNDAQVMEIKEKIKTATDKLLETTKDQSRRIKFVRAEHLLVDWIKSDEATGVFILGLRTVGLSQIISEERASLRNSLGLTNSDIDRVLEKFPNDPERDAVANEMSEVLKAKIELFK